MRTLLWVVLGLDYAFLLAVGSVRLVQFDTSDFQLNQLLVGVTAARARQLKRLHARLPEVKLLQQTELILAAIVSVVILQSLTGWLTAIIGSLAAFATIKLVSRLLLVQQLTMRLFEYSLDFVLQTTEVLHILWVALGVTERRGSFQPHSVAELLTQISKLPNSVIDSSQKQRIVSVIESESLVVKDIMTPKRRVVSVKPSATLGPVVLSDLQKSGHGFFPVFTKNSEPEGVLDISDLSDIQSAKQNNKVSDIMNTQIIWVEEDTSLQELIQAFLQEKQYLLLVRNLNGEYTGIVTIADLMRRLVGVVKE